MSRSPLLRGAELSDESVCVPLRPRIIARPAPTTAEGIAEQARQDAGAVRAASLAEAEALREVGRQEGYAEGRAAGEAEVAATLSALLAMAGGLQEQRLLLEESAVLEATQLAVEVAARLVRAEVAVRPERVVEVVRGAIRRAADRSRLVARVSPDDLAACRAAAPEILQQMGGISSLEVVDDPRITAGSCILETGSGDVDATFESQLGRILEALMAPPDEGLVEPDAR